jgi:hypothetical protein
MITVAEWQTGYGVGSSGFFVLLGKSNNLLQRKGIGDGGDRRKSVAIAKDGLDVMVVDHVVRGISGCLAREDRSSLSLNRPRVVAASNLSSTTSDLSTLFLIHCIQVSIHYLSCTGYKIIERL